MDRIIDTRILILGLALVLGLFLRTSDLLDQTPQTTGSIAAPTAPR